MVTPERAPIFLAVCFATAPSMLLGGPRLDGPVAISGPSPFASCDADRVTQQPGTVYLGSEVEPRLAVNPSNPENLVVAYQQDRWSNGGARGIVAGVSLDGGRSWRSVVIPGVTRCSGGTYDRASDPWVSFTPNGDAYLTVLALDAEEREPREFHDFSAPPGRTLPAGANAILVSRSSDGGLTWSAPVTLARDDAGPLNDKESVTADPTDPTGRLVYVVWDRLDNWNASERGPAMFSRTTDGGFTWEPARVIYDPGPGAATVGHQIVVLPDGRLLDLFTEFVRSPLPGGGFSWDLIGSVVTSADKGLTWTPATRWLALAPAGVVDPDHGRRVRDGLGLIDDAADSRNGMLYATWSQGGPEEVSTIDLRSSTDGGRTWSLFLGDRDHVNHTPAAGLNGQAFTPTIQVNARGTVAVSYYDFRANDAGAGALTDAWLVWCEPEEPDDCRNVDNWSRETRLTESSFDIEKAPWAQGFFLGDYMGLAADGEDFLASFVQPHGTDPASVFFRRVGKTIE
ncbi:MAG: exo-alpha-sialidase [Acidobacteria bacterium]|nr:exo-alpha-sialidase [Acidobacteriota bacterium]